MSLHVYVEDKKVLLSYAPDNGAEWIKIKFEETNEINIKRTFCLTLNDLVQTDENLNDEIEKIFIIGNLIDDFYRIKKEILNTKFDVLFHKSCKIKIEFFIVNSNISVFSRFEKLAKQQIIISGDKENSIPENEFNRIVKSFPTRTELNH
ncbi:MAG: hypothetical protein ACK46Y_10040 [Fluviicola sp.]